VTLVNASDWKFKLLVLNTFFWDHGRDDEMKKSPVSVIQRVHLKSLVVT